MSTEQPAALTSEQQTEIEKERTDYEKQTQAEAEKQNEERSLGEKILGKNRLSAADIAHGEASKEDHHFNLKKRHTDEKKKFAEFVEASFALEMGLAKQGSWQLEKSRFYGAYLQLTVRGKSSSDADRATQYSGDK